MVFSNLLQADKKVKYTPSTTLKLSQLGGLGKVINESKECVELPIAHSEIFIELGIEPGRGVLLHGPPCEKKQQLQIPWPMKLESLFSQFLFLKLFLECLGSLKK